LLESFTYDVNHFVFLEGRSLSFVGLHDFVEGRIVVIARSQLSLELVDLVQALSFVSVLLLHLVVFDCFVELFVLGPLLFFFKRLDALLLPQKATLDRPHVLVTF
jgi:hypothetical protein